MERHAPLVVTELDTLASRMYSGVPHETIAFQVQQLERVESLPTLLSGLQWSSSSYTIFLSSQVIRKLVQRQPEQFSSPVLLQLSNELFQTLVNRSQLAETFCLTSLMDTISVVVRRGLLDEPSLERFPMTVMQTVSDGLWTTSGGHSVPPLVWKLFASLIQEVANKEGFSSAHVAQRVARRFRDGALLFIFQTACRELGVLTSAERWVLDAVSSVMELMCVILNFDFRCSAEETSDQSHVELPTEWRQSFLYSATSPSSMDGNIADFLWRVILQGRNETLAGSVFQSLAQTSSIRRSFFQTDQERQWWLQRFMNGTLEAMNQLNWEAVSQQGYAEFCRLLNRVKPNFQINELLASPLYERWIRRVQEFTCCAFEMGAPIGHLSLVSLWSNLLSSASFARRDRETLFDDLAPRVALSYVRSRFQLSEAWSQGPTSCVESIFDDGSDEFTLSMDFVGTILRFTIKSILDEFGNMFRPLGGAYAVFLSQGGSLDPTVEEKLAWVVGLIGGLLISPLAAPDQDGELTDGLLVRAVLDLLPLVSERVKRAQGSCPDATMHLEQACLFFLHCLRKKILGETTAYAARILRQLQEQDGEGGHKMPADQQPILVEMVMKKVVHNLTYWVRSPRIMDSTLHLLAELSRGLFTLSRQLSWGSVVTHQLLWSPEAVGLPFFAKASLGHRYRVRFRATLSAILFLDPTLNASKFRQYIDPTMQVLQEVERLTNSAQSGDPFASDTAREYVLGMLCDLRGVMSSCLNKRTYGFMSELLIPRFLPALEALLKRFADDLPVLVQVLRLVDEMVFNRCQRIQFEQHGAEGFHLFFFGARTIQFMASRLVSALQSTGGGDVVSLIDRSQTFWKSNELFVKGTSLTFHICKSILSGAYCNFGVLKLFGDDSLDRTLREVWVLLMAYSASSTLQYPKLEREWMGLVEQLLRAHLDFLATVPSAQLMTLLRLLEHAIVLPRCANVAATALGSLLMQLADPPVHLEDHARHLLHTVQQEDTNYLDRVVVEVFEGPIWDDAVHAWNVSQLLLPLLLVARRFPTYAATQQSVLEFVSVRVGNSSSTGNVEGTLLRLLNCDDLATMDRAAKDKFQQYVTQFRLATKGNTN